MATNGYVRHARTGGAADALDAIDGTNLVDKDIAFVIEDHDTLYLYSLDDDSGAAEDDPSIISPDTNAGDKRWLLIGQFFNTIMQQVAEPSISNGQGTIYMSDGSASDETAGDIIAKSQVGGVELKSWILSRT
jgi:hypothetical protein